VEDDMTDVKDFVDTLLVSMKSECRTPHEKSQVENAFYTLLPHMKNFAGEFLENCKLLGMSAEREAKLIADMKSMQSQINRYKFLLQQQSDPAPKCMVVWRSESGDWVDVESATSLEKLIDTELKGKN